MKLWIKTSLYFFLTLSLQDIRALPLYATGIPSIDRIFSTPDSGDSSAEPQNRANSSPSKIKNQEKKLTPIIESFYLSDLKTLLKSLEDPIAHGKLVAQVRALITLQTGPTKAAVNPVTETWDKILDKLQNTSRDILRGIGLASELPAVTKWFLTEAKRDPWKKWGEPILNMGLSALLGLIIGWFSKTLLRRPQQYVSALDIEKRSLFFAERVLQIVLWCLPYLCFALSTYMISLFLGINAGMESLLLDILMGGLVVRITHMCLKALLSPKYAQKRVVAMSDSLSRKIYLWLVRVSGWGMWFYFAILAMREIGLPSKVSDLFNQILGLVITVQIVYFLLHNRKAFRRFLEHTFIPHTMYTEQLHHRFLKIFAQIWHIPVVIGVCLFYLAVFFGLAGGFPSLIAQTGLSLGIFFTAHFMVNALARYRKEKFTVVFSKHFPRLHGMLHTRLHTLESALSYCIYVCAIYIQFRFWNIDLGSYITDDQNQVFPFVQGLFKTGIIVFSSCLIWIAVDIFVERYIEQEDEKALNLGNSVSARIRTLVPIIRKVLLFFLSAMVLFVFLGTIGIDTAPMLGGVAVISFAISLGAQGFIKDMFTGFFIILEDSVAVDDLVEIDGKKGMVEAVTIRSIRLRDDFGSVHTIPFGEVKILTNMTREYAYAVVNLNLSYEDNIDDICNTIKKIGNDLSRDPVYGPLILEPIDVKGIDKFADFSVVIQCRIKTKPGQQFAIKREFHRYIKNEFDRLGIVMPMPQQIVHLHQSSSQGKITS